ncbi:MAG: GNAT family N-acetyltransferase [Roseburia sp.]|nr:GNAT family N-acetyltransferase [Roseburia sp.]
MENVVLRAAVVKDYDAFNMIHSIANDTNAKFAPHVLKHAAITITLELFQEQLNSPEIFLYVAQYEEKIVGIISAEIRRAPNLPALISRSYVHVSHLCVSPEFRRQGIASALLDACKAWGKAQNAQSMEVMVMDKNENAIRTYENNGMVCLKRIYEVIL